MLRGKEAIRLHNYLDKIIPAPKARECWINVYDNDGYAYSFIPHFDPLVAIIAAASTPFKLLYRIHVRLK